MRGYRRGKKVIVHTRDGRSIEGVLISRYRDSIALGHAQLLDDRDPEAEGTALAGEVLVERSNVSFVQELS